MTHLSDPPPPSTKVGHFAGDWAAGWGCRNGGRGKAGGGCCYLTNYYYQAGGSLAVASPEFLVEVLDQEQDLRKSPAHTPLWYTAKLDSWNCTVDPNSTQPLPLAADWLQVICGGARQMLQSTAVPSTELKGTAAAMLPRPLDGAWRRILDSKIPRQRSIRGAADFQRPECCSLG